MGAIVAVKLKTNRDATETALTMLEAFTIQKAESYGIASSRKVHGERTVEQLRRHELNSSTIIGYAFTRTVGQDEPQPIESEDVTVAFDGRIYPAETHTSDAQVFCSYLLRNMQGGALRFIKEATGDFAFVIADSDRLLAGRDPLGVRPLYFGENQSLSALASEKKALWAIGIESLKSFPPGNMGIVGKTGLTFQQAKKTIHQKPKRMTLESAAQKLQVLLEQAVHERTDRLAEVAVAFSGGLDSSVIALLAKRSRANVRLIHVSLKDQRETKHAEAAAEMLGLPLRVRTFDEKGVAETLPAVLRAIEEPNPVKVSIGVPIYWAAQEVARASCRIMLAGQGGDELFAGYRRYVTQLVEEGKQAVESGILMDITMMYENNFERDFKICSSLGVELSLPFAARRIVEFALELPVELKIEPFDDTLRKIVLRHAARSLGLPEAMAERPKKAVQYATGVNNALKKLADHEGLTVKDYVRNAFQSAMKGIMPHA